MSQVPSRRLGFSFQELAWGVVLVALTGAGFFLHRYFAIIGILVMIVLLAGIAIRAVVLSGTSRAFALGFLVPYAMYLGATLTVVVRYGFFNEYEASGGQLITTQVMQSWLPPRGASTTLIPLRILHAPTLMTCGHMLVAFILGYLGGKYATAIYKQQAKAVVGDSE